VLPKPQEELLRAVVAIGKPVVVVILSGSMVATEWADAHVSAILEAWYPGQEGGAAVADVVFGNYNPGGRLPVTVYRSLDQVPLFDDYNVAAGRTYKYFDGDPLYPFGYGLSYTKFNYKKLNIKPSKIAPGESLSVSVSVTNAGKLAGDEVVQLYLTREDEQDLRNGVGDPLVPIRELQGFRRISLNPGETENVEFTLSPKQFARVNENGRLVVEPGNILVSVGGGQPGVKKRSGGKVAEPLYDEFEVVGLATLVD
jgi:beta-glucosidase